MATPEKKVKDRVKRMLTEHGAYHFMPATHGYGQSGVPDIVACLCGKFIGVECKANGGKPTALQTKNLMSIVERGGIAVLIDETGYEAFEMVLQTIDPRHVGGIMLDLLA